MQCLQTDSKTSLATCLIFLCVSLLACFNYFVRNSFSTGYGSRFGMSVSRCDFMPNAVIITPVLGVKHFLELIRVFANKSVAQTYEPNYRISTFGTFFKNLVHAVNNFKSLAARIARVVFIGVFRNIIVKGNLYSS